MIPTFAETLYWAIAGFAIYVLVYGLIDRICKCFEECARVKALGEIGKTSAEAVGMIDKIKDKI